MRRFVQAGAVLALVAWAPPLLGQAYCSRLEQAKKRITELVNLEADLGTKEGPKREALRVATWHRDNTPEPAELVAARQAEKDARDRLEGAQRLYTANQALLKKLEGQQGASPAGLKAAWEAKERELAAADRAIRDAEADLAARTADQARERAALEAELRAAVGPASFKKLAADPKAAVAEDFRGDPGSEVDRLYQEWLDAKGPGEYNPMVLPSSTVHRVEMKKGALDTKRNKLQEKFAGDLKTLKEIEERAREAAAEKLPEAQRRALALPQEVAAAKASYDAAVARRKQIDAQRAEVDTVRLKRDAAQSDLDQKDQELVNVRQRVPDHAAEVTRLESQLEALVAEQQRVALELAQARGTQADLEMKLANIEAEIRAWVEAARGRHTAAAEAKRIGDVDRCRRGLLESRNALERAQKLIALNWDCMADPLRSFQGVTERQARVEATACAGVALEEELVEVPLVLGEDVDVAAGKLGSRRLGAHRIQEGSAPTPQSQGKVHRQSPDFPTQVLRDTVVTVWHFGPPAGAGAALEERPDPELEHGPSAEFDPEPSAEPEDGEPGEGQGLTLQQGVTIEFDDGPVPLGPGQRTWAAVDDTSGGVDSGWTAPVREELPEDPCRGPRPERQWALGRVEAALARQDLEAVVATLGSLVPQCPGDAAALQRLRDASVRIARAEADASASQMRSAVGRSNADRQRREQAWASMAGVLQDVLVAINTAQAAAASTGGATAGGATPGGAQPGCYVQPVPGSARGLDGKKGVRWYVVVQPGTVTTVSVVPLAEGQAPMFSGPGVQSSGPYGSLGAAESAARARCPG